MWYYVFRNVITDNAIRNIIIVLEAMFDLELKIFDFTEWKQVVGVQNKEA